MSERENSSAECRALLSEKTFDEVEVGDVIISEGRRVTESDVVQFAALSGDYHPEHMDEEYAAKIHGTRIAHGVLILAMATGEVNQTGLFERTTVGVLEMKVRFIKVVKFNDTVKTVARIAGKRITRKADRGIVTIAVTVLNQIEDPVIEAEWVLMVKRS